MPRKRTAEEQAKDQQLETFRSESTDQALTTNQGLKVDSTNDSLKAGSRGPTLMEDFISARR